MLFELRLERGFSEEELGSASVYHPTYTSQLERLLNFPSLGAVFRLAAALEVAITFIVQRTEE